MALMVVVMSKCAASPQDGAGVEERCIQASL
jgi:hypothetical protein